MKCCNYVGSVYEKMTNIFMTVMIILERPSWVFFQHVCYYSVFVVVIKSIHCAIWLLMACK